MQIPHGPAHLKCPLHKKAMAQVCHQCPLWVQVRGKNPQTNDEVDRWDCSLALLPMLLIEGAQQQRTTTATIDALRKEVREANDVQMTGAIARLNRDLEERRLSSAPQQKLLEQ